MDPTNPEPVNPLYGVNNQPVQIIPQSKTPYIIGVVILLVFALIGLVLIKNKKLNQGSMNGSITVQNQSSPTASVPVIRGYLHLQASTLNVIKGQQVSLQLIADSDGEDITGFDGLVAYDTSAFDYVSVKSSSKDFNTYAFKRENHLSITAIKSLQNKRIEILNASSVATLTFLPKKSGTFGFELKSTIGKENTSMVDSKTIKLMPAVNAVTVVVK